MHSTTTSGLDGMNATVAAIIVCMLFAFAAFSALNFALKAAETSNWLLGFIAMALFIISMFMGTELWFSALSVLKH